MGVSAAYSHWHGKVAPRLHNVSSEMLVVLTDSELDNVAHVRCHLLREVSSRVASEEGVSVSQLESRWRCILRRRRIAPRPISAYAEGDEGRGEGCYAGSFAFAILQNSYATIGRHTLRCPRVEVASKRAKTDEGGKHDASLARAFVNG